MKRAQSSDGLVPSDLQPRHRPWLDGWRGIAILAVLLGHLFDNIPGMDTARFGVELFFVLSGRLMAEMLFVNNQPLGYFLKRRVARVWPALYVYVLIIAVVFSMPGPRHVDLGQVAGALTFTFNYVRIVGGPVLVFDHIWSLCVEEWAYVFLALFALIARKYDFRPAYPLLIIAALCVVNGWIQTAFGGSYRDVYWRTDVRVASIIVSCGLYLILFDKRVHPLVPIVTGVVGTFLNTYLFPDVLKYSAGTFLLAVSVTTIGASHPLVLRILSNPFLTVAGLWSFSLYLWQQPFTKVLHHWPFAAKLALLLAASLISFYLIEQPARRYLKKIWAYRPGPSQQPVRPEPAL